MAAQASTFQSSCGLRSCRAMVEGLEHRPKGHTDTLLACDLSSHASCAQVFMTLLALLLLSQARRHLEEAKKLLRCYRVRR